MCMDRPEEHPEAEARTLTHLAVEQAGPAHQGGGNRRVHDEGLREGVLLGRSVSTQLNNATVRGSLIF